MRTGSYAPDSWHTINTEYGNNQIKYSPDNGSNWKTINFVDGMYSYDDLMIIYMNLLKKVVINQVTISVSV